MAIQNFRKMGKSRNKRHKKTSLALKIIVAIIFILLAIGINKGYKMYSYIYQPNVVLEGKESAYFFIPTGSTMKEVVQKLYEKNYIINRASFEWLAEKKNYENHVIPGRYYIKDNMSNNELINLLRSGRQEPVMLTFTHVRTKEKLASIVSKQLEADSAEIAGLLNDKNFLAKYNVSPETATVFFIPNTYEFYWDTSAKEFIDRMYSEYEKFWTDERLKKAEKLGKTREEIITLASIVQEETGINKEKPRIAGVYLNRLEKGIRLQADPTVKYAAGDFSIRRVLNKHLKIDSPYNTYRYAGLPPGPINLPSVSSIDAVLNSEKHDYLYFCAKDDFSGYHVFSKTLRQHNINARKYRKALNKRKIYK